MKSTLLKNVKNAETSLLLSCINFAAAVVNLDQK